MATTAPNADQGALSALPPPLREPVQAYVDRLDLDLVVRAYQFSEKAHIGQKRASGENYLAHCVEVTRILAELHLDTFSLAAGLIHDTVEDTTVTLEEVRAEFGDEIATIVDGVTKIGKVQFRSSTEQQVENYRKLLLSMA
jgi:GTP diphosphokinase / guanosine-3',5'-bis(diphosphate) 3'-diphosphatase